jgi:hypothetical protein
MPQFDESVPPLLTATMRQYGIERIQEVPAVPAAGGLHYARSVRLEPDGEPWYLRSFGTDFRLIPRAWLRHGPRRCWSVGCDLDERDERDGGLLLVQALTTLPEEADALAQALTEELAPLSERVAARTGEDWQRCCCWISARIGAERAANA